MTSGEVSGKGPGNGRRELWAWLALTVLGSCLVLLAAGQVWVRVLGAQAADAAAPRERPRDRAQPADRQVHAEGLGVRDPAAQGRG
ncbi:hypothetical protein ACWCSD_34050, partial [Nonomuraea sp. NPDC001684]